LLGICKWQESSRTGNLELSKTQSTRGSHRKGEPLMPCQLIDLIIRGQNNSPNNNPVTLYTKIIINHKFTRKMTLFGLIFDVNIGKLRDLLGRFVKKIQLILINTVFIVQIL